MITPKGFIRICRYDIPFYINVANIAGVAPSVEFPNCTVIQLLSAIQAGDQDGIGTVSLGPGPVCVSESLDYIVNLLNRARW